MADDELAERVREALADRSPVREVRMFGGVSFMVEDKMVVNVRRGGDLLVRVDPADADDLLGRGARRTEMGAGRDMGPGWLTVPGELLDDEGLAFWMGVALAFHRTVAASRPRRRTP